MSESQPVWGTPPEIQHDGVKLQGNCSPCSSLTQCDGTPSSDRTRLPEPPPEPPGPPVAPTASTSVSMELSRYDLARCSLLGFGGGRVKAPTVSLGAFTLDVRIEGHPINRCSQGNLVKEDARRCRGR